MVKVAGWFCMGMLTLGLVGCGGLSAEVDVVSAAGTQFVEPTPGIGERLQGDPLPTVSGEVPEGAQPQVTPAPRPEVFAGAVPIAQKGDLWCIDRDQPVADGHLTLDRGLIELWRGWGEWEVIKVADAQPRWGDVRDQADWQFERKGEPFALNGFGGVGNSGLELVLANGTRNGMLQYFAPGDGESWQLIVDCESALHDELDVAIRTVGLDPTEPGVSNRVLLGLLTDRFPDVSDMLDAGTEGRLLDILERDRADEVDGADASVAQWEDRGRLERSFLDADIPERLSDQLEEIRLVIDSDFADLVTEGNLLCLGTATALDYCLDPHDGTLGIESVTVQRLAGEEVTLDEVRIDAGTTNLVRSLLTVPAAVRPGEPARIMLDNSGQPAVVDG